MIKIFFSFFIAILMALLFTCVIVIFHNMFIASFLMDWIQKNKKYNFTTGKRIELKTPIKFLNDKLVFYEYEIQEKKYKILMLAKHYTRSEIPLYYVKNPRVVVDDINKIGNYNYIKSTFIILTILIFLIIL